MLHHVMLGTQGWTDPVGRRVGPKLHRHGPFQHRTEALAQPPGGLRLRLPDGRKDLVAESAIGEAAFRTLHDVECSLMSFSPSDWNQSPIEVIWRREAEGFDDECVTVENFWTAGNLEERMVRATAPIQSWAQLQQVSERGFPQLMFGEDCFSPLRALPFRRSAATRLLELLRILERLAAAFHADGSRSRDGHRIYRDHFTGDNAVFSDSSPIEKRDFGQKLSFPHPDEPGEALPCSWHGKVRSMTLRMHFSWPVQYGHTLVGTGTGHVR